MKYRGLTYNREKECYEWVYGMPSYGYETDEIAEIGTVYGDFREIFPDTLGEQTPYRDKNGKEIYTGDIVALEVGGQIREFVVDKATVDREYNTLQGFTGKDGSNTVKVRLTPVEGERLQGYPDDWTKYGADGNIIADTARYRAIGNSICVYCAERLYIGIIRILQEEEKDNERKDESLL